MTEVLEHTAINGNIYLFGTCGNYGKLQRYKLVIYPSEETADSFAKTEYSGAATAMKATLNRLKAYRSRDMEYLSDFVARCKSRI